MLTSLAQSAAEAAVITACEASVIIIINHQSPVTVPCSAAALYRLAKCKFWAALKKPTGQPVTDSRRSIMIDRITISKLNLSIAYITDE